MVLNCPNDTISLNPLKKDVANYSWATFRQDFLAAISVALLTVPQAMAYALLAGLPLKCGLFSAIYSSIVAALFGSSRHLVVGPSNAISILIQSGIAAILFTYYRDLPPGDRENVAMQILMQITFMTSAIQLFAAWGGLGRLTQFVSHSVVIGYISGAALAMVINQLYVFLGMARMPGVHSLWDHGLYLLTHLTLIQWPTAMIGIGSLIILLFLKRFNKKIPAAVITFALAGILVEFLGLSSYSGSSWLVNHYVEDLDLPNVLLIGDTGEVYDLLPQFGLPFFNMRIINGTFPIACAIALLSIMESTSVAKTIAASSGQRLHINQEVFGIGMGNFLSSFITGMPVSGSPSRSGLNYTCGAKTRFASIFNALIVAFIVFLFGFFVTRIPLTAMSALLLVTAFTIVSKKQFRLCTKATSADAFVLWATVLACIFFSLDIAFYIGVALSITLYLKKAAIPHLVEYEIDDNGELRNLDHEEPHHTKGVRVIKVEGELFFGAADLFQKSLKTFAEDDRSTQVIILQLKNARDIDATVCLALQQLHEYLSSSGRQLVACGLTAPIWEVMSNSGLVELFGKENLFMFDERHPHQHMQKAIFRAKILLTSSPAKGVREMPKGNLQAQKIVAE